MIRGIRPAGDLFRAPGFVPLWIAGGVSSAMLWLEVLAAALFTLRVTGSGLDVALVSAARSLPLLAAGAFIGVVADAVDRKLILLGGLILSAIARGTVALLAAEGQLRPWQVGVAARVSGLVYATEMPARRRVIAPLGPLGALEALGLAGLSSIALLGLTCRTIRL